MKALCEVTRSNRYCMISIMYAMVKKIRKKMRFVVIGAVGRGRGIRYMYLKHTNFYLQDK